MANWFEANPARSIVVHTVIVAGAVWAAFAFVFDENKVAVYKAQTENEKAVSGQYKAKTEVLEVELARLRDENRKYLEWMGTTPHTIPYLEQRVKQLIEQNDRQRAELAAVRSQSPEARPLLPQYSTAKTISIGESFIDPKTNATLGLGRITPEFTASVVLGIPGAKPQEFAQVKPGTSWTFAHDGKLYQLTVARIDWFSNKGEVIVRETGDAPKKSN